MSEAATYSQSCASYSGVSRKHRQILKIVATALAVAVIYLLWLQNFGRVHLYDYSLAAYGNAYLQRGMRPYRDFGTPLQTLTYYLAYLSEWVFGRRYLAFGYSNLVCTYILFASAVMLFRRTLPFIFAVLAALSICIATTLQHGILWYNSLGVLLLLWFVLVSFDAIRRRRLTWIHIAGFAVLLLLTGTLKLNYHFAAAVIVGFCLIWLRIQGFLPWRRFLLTGAALAVWTIAAPVCLELLTTGASFAVWKLNVLIRPSGRAHDLVLLKSREFWFGVGRGYYPADPFSGLFALGLLCYASATVVRFTAPRSLRGDGLRKIWLPLCWIWTFFSLSVLLGLSNVDLGSAEATLPIGLLTARMLTHDRYSRRWLQLSALAIAGWLGCSGLFGIHRHARLLIPVEVFTYQVTYPVSSGYMKGALLAKTNAEELADAGRIVEKYHIRPGSREIYWGPGTEMFYRQFQSEPLAGFPLWYNPLTVRDEDVDEVVDHLQASPVRLFVADPFWYDLFVPARMRTWLDEHWILVREGTLILFIRPGNR